MNFAVFQEDFVLIFDMEEKPDILHLLRPLFIVVIIFVISECPLEFLREEFGAIC